MKHWLTRQLIFQKLNNPIGLGLLVGLAILLSYVIALFKLKIGIAILVMIVGVPAVGACLMHPNFALYVLLTMGVLVNCIKKSIDAPIGMAMDGLIFIAFFGIIIQQTKDRDFRFVKSPISVLIIIWMGFNFLQVLNPSAVSRLAWLYTVRSMAGMIFIYFIALYAFDSIKNITLAIKAVLAAGFISALYGLKQEFFGFSNDELAWLYSDPERLQLILQWSRLRIFSFFSDPTTFGTVMAYLGTFSFVLCTGPFSLTKKSILFFAGCCMFLSMAYAGSRTPFVLVPFGFVMFTILTLKKEVILTMGILFFLGAGFMMKSTSSAVVYRIQSAFLPGKADDTMQVRFKNQKFIQPIIYRHPVGMGLGSTGVWAKRFTPNSFLANFAHDSGYVRIAVEMGWIGLIIYMIFLFILLKTSIYYYLRVRNQKIKVFYLACTTIFFQLTLASYPQEVLVMLPTSIIFNILAAAAVRMKDFDTYVIDLKPLPPTSMIIPLETDEVLSEKDDDSGPYNAWIRRKRKRLK